MRCVWILIQFYYSAVFPAGLFLFGYISHIANMQKIGRQIENRLHQCGTGEQVINPADPCRCDIGRHLRKIQRNRVGEQEYMEQYHKAKVPGSGARVLHSLCPAVQNEIQ